MNRNREGRTLLLVDVENLLGGTHFTAAEVDTLRPQVIEAAGVNGHSAQVTVAASAGAALLEAGLGWSGARCVWRKGKDGADLALADVALNEGVAQRYGRVVICSGDGLFAVVARFLSEAGVSVTVVARPESLSPALARVAETRLLPSRKLAA